MHTGKLSIAALLITLTAGCSSSAIKSEQRMNLEPYRIKMKSACIGYYKRQNAQDQTDETIDQICTKEAGKRLALGVKMFYSFQEENMLKTCKEAPAEEYDRCLLDFQERILGNALDNQIVRQYGP